MPQVIIYTLRLGRQYLTCPTWSIDCEVSSFASWTLKNLALAQGIATVFELGGLVAIAYAMQCISETAIWPLHNNRPLSLDEMDIYLTIARGKIPPLRRMLQLFRSIRSALFLTTTIVATCTPFTAAPLLGYVWARVEATQQIRSSYRVGGGIGRLFAQTNPPVSVGAESLGAYISWSRELSQEPLREYRHWIADRSALIDIGNLTARAVRVQDSIACQPFELIELASPEPDIAAFSTQIDQRNSVSRMMNSSDHVKVRIAETMAVWADDFSFIHANRSSIVLIFAAFNGSIESGIVSQLSSAAYPHSTTISSISCSVDIEFIDDILVIGSGSGIQPSSEIPMLSSIDGIHVSFRNSTTNISLNTLNENALWFAAAPVIVCPSVDGAQPMYYKDPARPLNISSTYPTGYTKAPFQTHESATPNNTWTLAEITDFARVAIGATAMASSQNFRADHKEPAIITSQIYTRKLDPRRVKYLAMPLVAVLIAEVALLWWNIKMHQEMGLPVVKMAKSRDILDCVQTAKMASTTRLQAGLADSGRFTQAEEDAARTNSASEVFRQGLAENLELTSLTTPGIEINLKSARGRTAVLAGNGSRIEGPESACGSLFRFGSLRSRVD